MLVGIDLGTTNSLISIFEGNDAKIIENKFGDNLTPSVVSLAEDNNIFIGKVAKERLIQHSSRTVKSFKRNIGTNKSYNLKGSKFSSADLSSLVLKSLIEDVENFTKKKVTEAIISVPAYFNDIQRKDTLLAAKLAGIKVKRLVNEPTAAAIAYGISEKEDVKFLVFDLGGGTFDISIVEVFDGIIEIHASSGDNKLGGDDFSEVIEEKFKNDIQNQYKIKLKKLKDKELELLAHISDEAKHLLSLNEEFSKEVILNGKPIKLSISKDEFEKISVHLLDRIVQTLQRVLRDSKLRSGDLDNIVLVGGATKMPAIKKLIVKLFNKLPLCHLNPEEVVSVGASLLGEILDNKNEVFTETVVTDVTSFSLGIEISSSDDRNGKIFSPIIERNTVVPCSREGLYYPSHARQKILNVDVYQGESRNTAENIFLGRITTNVSVKPATDEQFLVRFTYDPSGIIEVIIKSLTTGKIDTATFKQNDVKVSEEEIKERFLKLKELKQHPRDVERNILILEKLNKLFEEHLGEKRIAISGLISEFEEVIASQDPNLIKEKREYLESLFDDGYLH